MNTYNLSSYFWASFENFQKGTRIQNSTTKTVKKHKMNHTEFYSDTQVDFEQRIKEGKNHNIVLITTK